MRENKDKDYKLEWRKAMDELVNLRQEYRELKEDKDYIKLLLDAEFKKGLNLKKENEKLRKMLNANYKTNNELVQYIQMLERDIDE